MMGDKSWLGDSGSVPTVSEWEEAVRNAPEPPDTGTEEIVVITGGLGEEWARLQRELSEARAALREVAEAFDYGDFAWLRELRDRSTEVNWTRVSDWETRHAAALKAAKEGQ
jgi:hypothetical protein